MQNPISITAVSSISPLGNSTAEIWNNYLKPNHFISEYQKGEETSLCSKLSETSNEILEKLRQETTKYRALDRSVLMALHASRKAIKDAQWNSDNNFGINIGSSRGATTLFEKYHSDFLKKDITNTLTSPTTTLGNISSWVAHDLQTIGPEISHSITCSTALHALLNGVAWINSGMSDKFLVGGSEAPLTEFTIAQMKALKIYSKPDTGALEVSENKFPCQALNIDKSKNTMVLGEGAALACLEKGISNNALAVVKGIGYATEILEHNASLSSNAVCFQRSMKMALRNLKPEEIDIIVTHTPGTIKGDIAEYKAIKKVFNAHLPSLTNNKWKLGHTLGASGLLSLEMAILMLQHQHFISVPYLKEKEPKKIQNIMINAVGFGGNAVSVIISKS
ncbi:beta-ketoacyl synthase N-terminal-like domain-containing protein [Ichthyenterobacterium sp. W332]|uniref:Beta-ketoacyl synthase N-terminal-like domain-containing protein n=1 Tax=Microcosmobacter mediterraneus TaxID=3075607 RepID=A0ABU2YI83_9FLAO|nr:beta-ketoacyl synthase N-terminal-like domain-containing protein [Ichthyenterobacterium sp. W332]MDT0557886.1 beta-ketoacyl synthase N-terminal-like domain-containing protein [Ichthyenterobacterium sp. W332]